MMHQASSPKRRSSLSALYVTTLASTLCILALVALAPTLSHAQTTSADFGTNYALTSTPTSYSYVSGGNPPLLTISGTAAASNVKFNLNYVNEVTIGSSPSFGLSGYPAGFSALSPPFLSGSLGFSITLSNSAVTNLAFQLTFPQLTTDQVALFAKQQLAVLYYDVQLQVYTRLSSSIISLNSTTGLLSLNGNQPGYFYVLNLNTQQSFQAVEAAPAQYLIAANSSQSFSGSYNGILAVTLANFNAPAGIVSIVATSKTAPVGKYAVSPDFYISYTGGSTTAVSATLLYNLTGSPSNYDLTQAAWNKMVGSTWVAQTTTSVFVNNQPMLSTQVADPSGDWSVMTTALNAASAIHVSPVSMMLLALVATFIRT